MAAQVAAIVAQGGGGMPAFAGQLSSDQIKAVADYVEHAPRWHATPRWPSASG
jgi:mono/diheme cytochrome c family protein